MPLEKCSGPVWTLPAEVRPSPRHPPALSWNYRGLVQSAAPPHSIGYVTPTNRGQKAQRRENVWERLARNVMARGGRCSKPLIQQGPTEMREAETMVLHAVSSSALDPPFAACDTPAPAAISRPFRFAFHDCTQLIGSPYRNQNRIRTSRAKSREFCLCSPFLPYVFAGLGLPP